jgi:hypothetical protein
MLLRIRFVFLLLFVLKSSVCDGITLEEFLGFPFTSASGWLRNEDDFALHFPITEVPFKFLGKEYGGLQVDTNGHVDFTETPLGARIYPHNFPSTGRMSVSPFGIDLDNSVNTDNQVYYAIYTSENISLISDSISKVVDVSSDFDGTYRPKWAMVVTWEDQAYFSNKSLEVTLQAALTTDGEVSFVVFNYDANGIEGVLRRTAIGYTSGDKDNFYHLPPFITQQVDSAVGNTGVVGQWVFRIDGGETHAIAGKEAFIYCHIPEEYQSEVTFQWKKNGSLLNDTQTIRNTSESTLVLRNVSYSDYGQYHCYVNTTEFTRSTLMTVSPYGSVMVTPNILFINYGDNVTLHCRGNGGPNNSYQWSRQGIPLPGEAGDTFIVSDSLVNPEHLGMFTCTVSNAAGSQQASAEIHGFKLKGPGGGSCKEYLKSTDTTTAEVCMPTFVTDFPSESLKL